jgi:site-specific recombinase XerD
MRSGCQPALEHRHQPGRVGPRQSKVRRHGLRYAFADELRAAGVDVVVISKLLGHSSIAVTSRYLDHLTNAQAVSALEEIALPALGES